MIQISLNLFVYGLFSKQKPTALNKEQNSRWITGFIDGESNFQVYLDREYLKVMFRIRLHIDDIAVLFSIRDFLGAGRVRQNGNNCQFIISDVNSLTTVLIPLLDQYGLFTSKWLDYLDFKLVVAHLSSSNTTRLSSIQLAWVRSIMSGMNSGRISYNYDLIPRAATHCKSLLVTWFY